MSNHYRSKLITTENIIPVPKIKVCGLIVTDYLPKMEEKYAIY
jgi:hypothetical protein